MYAKLPLLLLLVLLAGICSAGCINTPDAGTSGRLTVAVSIVPEETFVKAVAGDKADILVMIPPGYSPENYEPSPLQMQKLNSADIYFTIGTQTEENSILPSVNSATQIVKLQDAVSAAYPDRMLGSERDPHIWLSPKRAIVIVGAIAAELSKADPANASFYKANAENYTGQLKALDTDLKSTLSSVQNKKFIVYHPAFGYFADEYDLSMYALEEEGKEATIRHIAEMADFARAEGIKVVFYQDEVDSSQSAAFAEEIGGTTFPLSPLSGDYIENLKYMAAAIRDA